MCIVDLEYCFHSTLSRLAFHLRFAWKLAPLFDEIGFTDEPLSAETYYNRIAFEIFFVFIFEYPGRDECFYITVPQ
jgi:hypothetical protein